MAVREDSVSLHRMMKLEMELEHLPMDVGLRFWSIFTAVHFWGEAPQEKCFDGSALAAQGMVVVTVNFRLGIFGYAAFPELEARDGHAGNYGMYDAYAALEWVQKHIADFGGDPANVTLMGQSAGARMVQLLCLSPKVKGFVHRAVMCSGGGQVRLFGRHRRYIRCGKM